MAGPQPFNRKNSEPIVTADTKYQSEKEEFLKDCRTHVVRKANYKSLGNGQFVRMGRRSWLKTVIEGNTADARYHRAAYDSRQRVSAALISENYRCKVCRQPPDLSNSDLVKARFYRQDNLRFNPQLSDPKFGLSDSDKRAIKYSIWAHRANGVTELGAAPTGMLLKCSKLIFTPKSDDKTFVSQVRVVVALPFVLSLVALISKWPLARGLGFIFKKVNSGIQTEIRALACSFSAVSAVSSLVSLACVAGSSVVGSRAQLSAAVMGLINRNKDNHLQRIYLLVNDVKNKPGGEALLSKALQQKIGQSYRIANGMPILLNRLLVAVRGAEGEFQAIRAIEQTIGSYLTETSPTGSAHGSFLDSKTDKAELLARENHFVALTNLVEHYRIGVDKHDNFKDARHFIEDGAEKLREVVVNRSPSLLNVLGFVSQTETASKRSRNELRYNSENMLNNPHQYGPVTRGLARASAALRVFNHGVILSLNYQLTRPIASLAGVVTESAFKVPNSRTTSFSIGRAFASSIWAVLDAFLIIPLAAGNGLAFGGQGANSAMAVKFPIMIPFGSRGLTVSIISTAAQMLVVAVPATILLAAAKGACYLEGWNGCIARRRELAGSHRDPERWN